MLFGRDTEADANARSNARQMFDGDMLIHGDLLVSRVTSSTACSEKAEASGREGAEICMNRNPL